MTTPALSCRCCGSSNTAVRGRKSGLFYRREFAYHQCGDCGFMSVEPFSGFGVYDDAYYRGKGPDPFVDYEAEYRDWERSDRRYEFRDLAEIAGRYINAQSAAPGVAGAAKASSPGALEWMDFGCGAGGFLKFLRQQGSLAGRPLAISGHDVGSYADLLKRDDGFRILDLDALQAEPSGRYDVISMIEVIEHLPSPLEPTQLVARLLKPGGLLLLTTGNLDSPIARRQGLEFGYCVPEIHVSLFNPRCLATLYQRVGLTPHPVRFGGALRFKILKNLRHRPAARAIAVAALAFPGLSQAADALYGVSRMPCAVKPPAP